MPSTLTGLIQARLDGLFPAERAVLQRAAIVGRIFWDDAVRALEDLEGWSKERPIAEFLLSYPSHRAIVRRAQMSVQAPYGEIRDNTISAMLMPIDMLRAKLSFFGATRFDPRSDRWVRITMYAGAPYPETLDATNADLWVYPEG